MIQELINLISDVEGKELKNYSRINKHYDIAPINTNGSPIEDASARPTLVFDILDDELAVKWIYLNVQNQGLGTRIIQWFIDYCRKNGIGKISIRLVGEDNSRMRTLSEKLGFRVIRKRNCSLDYELLVED
ncbi:GNAT family N-acetyltransferase [Tissierella praeacuta]|uniref:GNAT family N-acetyltransferase n=1 Tax=Tissierella praeacuta TaxID=43131 RepID=UPI00334130DB